MFYTIYKTTNIINGKVYIGKHIAKSLDDSYLGSGKLLIKAISKYGIEIFKKEVLVICETKEEMDYIEKSLVSKDWLDKNKDKTYNLKVGGEGGVAHGNTNRLGTTQSEKTKKLMSDQRKGEKHPFFGRKQTEESKLNMSLHKKGILRWVNNGVDQRMINTTNGIPQGYSLGRGWR